MKAIFLLFMLAPGFAQKGTNSVKNKTHILCLTEDESPVYVEPLQVQKPKILPIYLQAPFKKTGWKLKNLTSTTPGPILDKRWEDLEIFYDDYHYFTSISSLSFSVYGGVEIIFFIDDVVSVDRFSIPQINPSLWHHYTIVANDSNVYLYETFLNNNNTQSSVLVRTVMDLTPVQLVIKSKTKTFWKIHDYAHWYSETTSEVSTDLTVPTEVDRCLMIYASICEHCCLHVNEKSICGKANESSSQPMYSLVWHNLKIDRSSAIKFMRTTTDGSSNGHWSIDIRQCPRVSKDGSFIYEIFSNSAYNMNSTCKLLNNGTVQTSRSKRNVKYDVSKCEIGFFGSKCNISCENLLGHERKYCEQHQICQDDDCNCAWGFEGRFCNEPCQPGHWGSSCRNMCPKNCSDNCNTTTGICEKVSLLSLISEISGMWWGIYSIVALIVIVLISLLCYKFCNGKKKLPLGDKEEESLMKNAPPQMLEPCRGEGAYHQAQHTGDS